MQMRDGDLLKRLDAPADWHLLDGVGRSLTRSLTLRHALRQVRMLMSGGVMPASLHRGSGRSVFVPMDQLYRVHKRVTESDHQAVAKTHLARGEAAVAKQRQTIENLLARGHDTAEAVAFLALLVQSLELMRRHLRAHKSDPAADAQE